MYGILRSMLRSAQCLHLLFTHTLFNVPTTQQQIHPLYFLAFNDADCCIQQQIHQPIICTAHPSLSCCQWALVCVDMLMWLRRQPCKSQQVHVIAKCDDSLSNRWPLCSYRTTSEARCCRQLNESVDMLNTTRLKHTNHFNHFVVDQLL